MERRNLWHSHRPPTSAQVTRVWLGSRRSLRAGYWQGPSGATLTPAPAAGPACLGLVSVRKAAGVSGTGAGTRRGQGHTSLLRPGLSCCNRDFVNFFSVCLHFQICSNSAVSKLSASLGHT